MMILILTTATTITIGAKWCCHLKQKQHERKHLKLLKLIKSRHYVNLFCVNQYTNPHACINQTSIHTCIHSYRQVTRNAHKNIKSSASHLHLHHHDDDDDDGCWQRNHNVRLE